MAANPWLSVFIMTCVALSDFFAVYSQEDFQTSSLRSTDLQITRDLILPHYRTALSHVFGGRLDKDTEIELETMTDARDPSVSATEALFDENFNGAYMFIFRSRTSPKSFYRRVAMKAVQAMFKNPSIVDDRLTEHLPYNVDILSDKGENARHLDDHPYRTLLHNASYSGDHGELPMARLRVGVALCKLKTNSTRKFYIGDNPNTTKYDDNIYFLMWHLRRIEGAQVLSDVITNTVMNPIMKYITSVVSSKSIAHELPYIFVRREDQQNVPCDHLVHGDDSKDICVPAEKLQSNIFGGKIRDGLRSLPPDRRGLLLFHRETRQLAMDSLLDLTENDAKYLCARLFDASERLKLQPEKTVFGTHSYYYYD